MDSLEYQQLLNQCIHCGLCHVTCPSYAVLGTEMDSPRGRIALMKAAANGRIDLVEDVRNDGAFTEHIDLCLGCRACETACPSGVQYGRLLEVARDTMAEHRQDTPSSNFLRRLSLEWTLPNRQRMRLMARALSVYQRTGVSGLIRRSNLLSRISPTLETMEGLLPNLELNYPTYRQAEPALALDEKQGSVAFLHGCVQDAFLSGVNKATISVLQHNGYDVYFPQTQTCCGAAGLHIGETELGHKLARQNIDAIIECSEQNETSFDAIISNAGGCGAVLKDYDHLLAADSDYSDKAADFAHSVQDVTEFLANHILVETTGAINAKVAYMDSCHLRHGQKVVQQPRQLLAMIPGVEVVDLAQPDMCCGSAGIYNIMQADTAEQVLEAKMNDIINSGAEIVVTTNTGCHMQLLYGVRKFGLDIEVIHLVELLERSYSLEG